MQRVRDVLEETQTSKEITDEYIEVELCLCFNFCQFEGECYFEEGLPMGSPCPPPPFTAEVLMKMLESKVLVMINPYFRNMFIGDVMLTTYCVYRRAVR